MGEGRLLRPRKMKTSYEIYGATSCCYTIAEQLLGMQHPRVITHAKLGFSVTLLLLGILCISK